MDGATDHGHRRARPDSTPAGAASRELATHVVGGPVRALARRPGPQSALITTTAHADRVRSIEPLAHPRAAAPPGGTA